MTLWYTARGAGLAALVLLTISTALGALVSRPSRNAARRYVVQYMHRVAAGLGLMVLVLHVGTIIADSYADVGWTGAFILTSSYRPVFVALGTLAAYTFVAVAALGMARGRMAASPRGARVWRKLHSLAYVGWGTAMLHGFTAGTDSGVGWVRLLYLTCFVAVAAAFVVRVSALETSDEGGGRFAHLQGATR